MKTLALSAAASLLASTAAIAQIPRLAIDTCRFMVDKTIRLSIRLLPIEGATTANGQQRKQGRSDVELRPVTHAEFLPGG